MSLWVVEQRPDVFGRCLAVSPALLFDGGVLPKRWATAGDALPVVSDATRRVRFWIDVGGAERVRDMAPDAYVDAVRATADGLVAAGLQRDRDVRFLLAPGARHDERAWAERFPDALRFLFPPVPRDRDAGTQGAVAPRR
jgi:predicted alpha/beta superfamily hydrolase